MKEYVFYFLLGLLAIIIFAGFIYVLALPEDANNCKSATYTMETKTYKQFEAWKKAYTECNQLK